MIYLVVTLPVTCSDLWWSLQLLKTTWPLSQKDEKIPHTSHVTFISTVMHELLILILYSTRRSFVSCEPCLTRMALQCRRAYVLPLCFSFLLFFFLSSFFFFQRLIKTHPGIYPHGLGAKTLFGTDFELWPNIFLQRNMISTIGKKIVNLQGLSYVPTQKIRWTLVQKRLRTVSEFLPTP